MHKLFLIFVILFITSISFYFRFSNLEFSYLHPDSGYELEVGRIVNLSKRLPLIGPALSQNGIYIPPTYLYIISYFYFLGNGQLLIISLGFALFGFLTGIFLSLLIYLLTSNKKIFVLFFAMFSVWGYSVDASRTIWHPHPLLLFLTVSLFFLVLALKNNKIIYLFLSQWLFFFSLSIYPSPIFFLPTIVFGSFYFFDRSTNNLFKSLFYTSISLSLFFTIIYLPQIIFEISNNFISLRSVFSGFEISELSASSLISHLYKSFQLFLSLFFTTKSKIIEFIFFIFCFLTIVMSYIDRRNQSNFAKVFTSPFLLLWIFFIIIFLKSQSVYSPQRIDVLSIILFVLLAINLSAIIKLKSSVIKIFLCAIMSTYFFIFLQVNFRTSLDLSARKNIDSPFFYDQIAKSIIKEIGASKIPRNSVYIFNDNGSYKEDSSESYLWYTKWMAERIDHFVNRVFYEENPLANNYQHTLNYVKRLSYLDADFYFLICRNNSDLCVSRFLQSLKSLDGGADSQFLKVKNISLNQSDLFLKTEIFLIAKQKINK